MFRFISLGSDCQTASQIAGLAYTPTHNFFDLLALPIRQTIELIENDFEGLLLPENLHPVYVEDQLRGVVDMRYRAEFAHDFTIFSRDEIATVRERYRLRARWFRELFDADEPPVYFVRRWHARDGVEDETLAVRLFELLQSKRRDSRMLYLHRDRGRPEFVSGAYRSAYLPPPDVPHWTGNTPAWTYMLQDFALRGVAANESSPAIDRRSRIAG